MTKDTLVVLLSDMHSGGTTALFPDRFVTFKSGGNHTPSARQQRMWNYFVHCAKEVRAARKGKRVILVHNGDAIDGVHNSSLQIVTYDKGEQIDLHIELMNYFMKHINWQRGDELYYTKGTEVHTNDNENEIGRQLNAVQAPDDLYVYDDLKLVINGKRIYFTHHGPNAGKGANTGNAHRNWLRDRFYACVNEGEEPPHFIISGHTHNPYWQIYIARYQGEYFPVRGLICPSWQQKTRYAHRVAPIDKNKIGLQYFTITKDGSIGDPIELIKPQTGKLPAQV